MTAPAPPPFVCPHGDYVADSPFPDRLAWFAAVYAAQCAGRRVTDQEVTR